MSVQIAPITSQKHANTKIKPLSDFSPYKERHICPLTVHEFSRAASCFPIVFLKKPETEAFSAVAMLSTEIGSNKFVTEDGKWTANYLPQHIARVPYCISSDDEPVICIDENDPRVSEEEGEALFTEEGERTDYFKHVIESMQTLIHQDGATKEFLQKMAEMELLQDSSLTITRKDGKKQEITGIWVIDEPKFKELTDEQVLELNKLGYLGLIYVHFCSLGQTQNLVA